MIVRAAPPEHHPWIAARAGLVLHPQFRAIEAVDGDRIVGMVGYDGWTNAAVSMHVAIEHPGAARALLKPAFGVAFDAPPRGFGKRVIFGIVRSDNARALKFDKSLGFQEVMRLRDAWDEGIDLVFLELRREDCRWFRKEPG